MLQDTGEALIGQPDRYALIVVGDAHSHRPWRPWLTLKSLRYATTTLTVTQPGYQELVTPTSTPPSTSVSRPPRLSARGSSRSFRIRLRVPASQRPSFPAGRSDFLLVIHSPAKPLKPQRPLLRLVFIANALKQHPIGLEKVADGIWSIYFCRVLLGRIDERDYIIRA